MTQSRGRHLQCWNCGQSLADFPLPLSRHDHCPKCFEALHCCRLCRHFRPASTIPCAEDRADPPTIKENANFCDWFRPAAHAWSARDSAREQTARSELEALFGAPEEREDADDSSDDNSGSSSVDKAELAKRQLNSLFPGDT
jgi:hypothetical protein